MTQRASSARPALLLRRRLGALLALLVALATLTGSLLPSQALAQTNVLAQAEALAQADVLAQPALSQPALSQPGEASAQSTGEPLGTGSRTATVAITDIGPAVPEEGDELTIRGTLTNEGDSPIIGSWVAARQGMPLTSRDAIDQATSRTGFDVALDGTIIRGHSQDIDTIAPGMSRTFSLRVPLSEFALGDTGVYQIGVILTGQTEEAQWEQPLGIGRTVLPWVPEGGQEPSTTELTVLWPLISTTHLTAQTDSTEQQTPAFRDESLLTEISPGGRLHQLVTLGSRLPVTWVIDPDLLASVDAMTEEYQVFTEDGSLVPGDGQAQANAWLGMLKEVVADSEVIALPFGDPDLASLAHQGDVPGALWQLKKATETAHVTLDTILDVEPSTDFAWPVEGAIDPSIVSVATSAGASAVIARSDSMGPGELGYTPSAARPIGGGTTAVVSDARLSTLFEGDMTRQSRSSLAQQQLFSQTLGISQEDPGYTRSVVLAPQRTLSTTQAQAMANALTAMEEDAGWVSFVPLTEAAHAEPDPAANQRVPGPGQYPDALRSQELPTSAFQAMRETQRTLDDFAVILTEPDRVTVPYGNAIRREMSVSWRGNAVEAESYRIDLQSDLVGLTGQVHLIQKSPVTLSGRSATIPVTVQNNLVQDVTGLTLELTSSRELGLEVSERQEITISGGQSQSFKFSTTANANGESRLTAQLYTEDGKPYGEPMTFGADVTSITPVVMMVIALGLLLVVLAGIRMYTQRKRAARLQESTGASSGQDEDAPSSDTREDSTSTLPEGEKLGRND
ncbi:DUF6049 family protein [Streptomyces sp. 4N509B]|uniref:DUF6049 family protein n=1 Tax=Streptomyces sp. 4N509B TaxID=3457413 RepID=UPI003FD4464F